MKLQLLHGVVLFVLGCAFAASSPAEEHPTLQLNVIGGGSHNYSFRTVERPFWSQTLPAASDGKVTARLRGLSETGLKGPEMVRLLRSGAVEVGMGVFAFVAGDDPAFEGIDLPGMAADIDTARSIANAYKPVLQQRMAERHGVKLLATVPYTAQVFFCRDAVESLDDLRGRKVRVRGRNMADLVNALGASPITLPFAEVVTAMQTGVIDCAVTGIGSGNAAKWYEVANHLYNLPVDWSLGFYGIGLKRWEQLPGATQQLLLEQAQVLEDDLWQETARENRYALACNTGVGDCQIHRPAHMQANAPSTEERQHLHETVMKIAETWGQRCGTDCVERWNATVGKTIGTRLDTAHMEHAND
ncbi:transporter [Ectopseudomonas composti]|uniref:Transporter n=1 Tax=Ectopseudomonas composti TaxID=658457 RepID=A0ABN0SAJ3_9GAMM|nr:TRAP transporter substrate-binding protein [Pseudomonas composti]EZH79370.1 transporter [Pseudomonas composti]